MELLQENNQISIIANGKIFPMPEHPEGNSFYELSMLEKICDYLPVHQANELMVAVGNEVKAEQKWKMKLIKQCYVDVLSCCEFCMRIDSCKFIRVAKHHRNNGNTPLAVNYLSKCRLLGKFLSAPTI